jgi:hypothetical protein
MARSPEDLSDSNASEEEAERHVDAMRDALQRHLKPFVDEHDDPYGLLPMLLAELATSTQMTYYVLSVEQPSGSGLRRKLDRFQRDIEGMVRDFKKQADDYVAHMKQAIAEAEASDDPE